MDENEEFLDQIKKLNTNSVAHRMVSVKSEQGVGILYVLMALVFIPVIAMVVLKI